MEHLRRAICVDEIVIGAEEVSREDVGYIVFVVECEGASVDYIGAAGVHPRKLIERQRGQIEDQPILYPSQLDQRELAVFVRVDQLSGQDSFIQPLGSRELGCRSVKVLERLRRCSRGWLKFLRQALRPPGS